MDACETDGATELLAPEAAGALGEASLLAAADWVTELSGLLRAEPEEEADWAMDCAEACAMVCVFTARAPPLCTDELAEETEGEKEAFDPAALALDADCALLPEADCEADALLGLLRAAFMFDED